MAGSFFARKEESMAIIYVKPKGEAGNGEGFSPSAWSFGLQDISASDSGRTRDSIMHKNRVSQKRKIGLSFNGTSKSETSRILKAFNPEYIDVHYEDDMDAEWQWRTFYVGDRSAVRKWWMEGTKIHEIISFDIIEV